MYQNSYFLEVVGFALLLGLSRQVNVSLNADTRSGFFTLGVWPFGQDPEKVRNRISFFVTPEPDSILQCKALDLYLRRIASRGFYRFPGFESLYQSLEPLPVTSSSVAGHAQPLGSPVQGREAAQRTLARENRGASVTLRPASS